MNGWADRYALGSEPLPPGIGELFKLMLGAPPSPGSGPFTHTWSPVEPGDVHIVGLGRRRVRIVAHANARRLVAPGLSVTTLPDAARGDR